MKRHILSAPARGVLAIVFALHAIPAAAQETRVSLPASDEAHMVLPMAQVGHTLRMTVGYSKMLQADEPFGTIIVGDDTIANATVGIGNSIIVTGLTAGTTNLIVLGQSQEMLMSAVIAVAPEAGPLRATVTVVKGLTTREHYECSATNCTLVSPPADTKLP